MFPDDNRREFQRGIDPEAGKQKRHEERLNLRRQIREGHLSKRRKALSTGGDEQTPNSSNSLTQRGGGNNPPIPSWVRLENLNRFVQQIKSNEIDAIYQGVQAVRQLLSVEERLPIDQIFQADIVINLLKIIKKKIDIADPSHKTPEEDKKCKLQFEAAWALTNIASGEREHTRKLVEMGCVEAFVELLKHTKDIETVDQAIWGLGNIAGDCPNFRDRVLQNGVLEYILDKLNSVPDNMRRNAVWTLSNFCRGKPSPDWNRVSKLLNPLTQLLTKTKDYDVIVDILWALSFLSEDREDNENNNNKDSGQNDKPESYQVDAVIRTGILKYIIQLVKHASQLGEEAWAQISELRAAAARDGLSMDQNIPLVVRQKLSTSDFLIAPCVRIMGNIVSGSDQQTEEVVKAGFYDIIELCIDHRVKNIKKESCWALSNVMAGSASEQLEQFFKRESLVKKVVDLCLNGELNIRKEAGWCLSNALCSATFEQTRILVAAGFIEAMVELLRCTQAEKILLMAMEALETCLISYNKSHHRPDYEYNAFVEKMEHLGGLDRLEEIQITAPTDRCYDTAVQFVTKFWPESGEEERSDGDNDNDNYNDNDNGENTDQGDGTFTFSADDEMMKQSGQHQF